MVLPSASLGGVEPTHLPGSKPPKQMRGFVTATTQEEFEAIASQWANFFYASRIPFLAAENEEFKKALEMTRPGFPVQSINRRNLSGKFLENKNKEIGSKECDQLAGKRVVIS